MVMAHQNFMTNIGLSLDILEAKLKEAGEMSPICTDEWYNATESTMDDMHKSNFESRSTYPL